MKTNLKVLREELNPTVYPEDFAKMVGLRPFSYVHIEQGRRTTYTTAKKILTTLNQLRVERGLLEVSLEDLGINIA